MISFLYDEKNDYYSSPFYELSQFDNHRIQFAVWDFDENLRGEYDLLINSFLGLTKDQKHSADKDIFRYYQDMLEYIEPLSNLKQESDVWKHIRLGSVAYITQRYKDKLFYLDIECACDWEIEHGLQLILRHGNQICKVGGYDGHLLNSDAYGRPELEDMIYYSFNDQ
jgi:hypothetical protein